ncbi:hypothetical protein, partial [uncultured Peptoniphilus sp.]|uniref:hypothetical protein n=1 Tax=uncultured Peptoniphilus sp. TaxID=254354 RepID=UPI0035A5B8EF
MKTYKKKFMALTLAGLMLASLPLAAFAEETESASAGIPEAVSKEEVVSNANEIREEKVETKRETREVLNEDDSDANGELVIANPFKTGMVRAPQENLAMQSTITANTITVKKGDPVDNSKLLSGDTTTNVKSIVYNPTTVDTSSTGD